MNEFYLNLSFICFMETSLPIICIITGYRDKFAYYVVTELAASTVSTETYKRQRQYRFSFSIYLSLRSTKHYTWRSCTDFQDLIPFILSLTCNTKRLVWSGEACLEWLSKIIHRRVTFMGFGVLKIASVISRSLHSQESHIRALNVQSFTHPVKNNTL